MRVLHPELPVNEQVAKSGSRLRRRWAVASDGSRHFVGWRDTLLNVDCEFTQLGAVPASDPRTYYCTPLDKVTVSAFSSAACEGYAVPLKAACSAAQPSYVVLDTTASESNRCPAGERRVMAVGETLATYYDSTCTEQQPAAGVEWHAAEVVDASAFARGELVRWDLGEGLFLERIVGDDGAEQALSFWYDGARCSPEDVGFFSGRRCATDAARVVASTTAFSGPTCGDPLVTTCNGGRYRHWTSRDCYIYVDRLERPDEVYGMKAGECVRLDGPERNNAFGGEWVETDPTMLPELVSTPDPGMERLRNALEVTPGGSTIALGAIYDTVLQTTCTPLPLSDGTVRCVPSAERLQGYVQADCTTPVGFTSFPPCATPEFYMGFSPETETCKPTVASVWRSALGSWDDPAFTPNGDGTCEESSGGIAVRLEPLDLASLPTLLSEVD